MIDFNTASNFVSSLSFKKKGGGGGRRLGEGVLEKEDKLCFH